MGVDIVLGTCTFRVLGIPQAPQKEVEGIGERNCGWSFFSGKGERDVLKLCTTVWCALRELHESKMKRRERRDFKMIQRAEKKLL